MNCIEFKTWILDINAHDRSSAQAAKSHMAACPKCEKLYALDQLVEVQFNGSLTKIDPPADLYTRIKLDIPSAPAKKRGSAVRWRMLAPALAAAAIVFVVFLNFPGGQIRDIDHIGSLALVNHLDDRQRMAFKAGEIKDVATWFIERIGFAATEPNLVGQGYAFLGGRQCKLGPYGAAYLFYEKNGQKCSLFIMNPADLKFKVKPDKKYYLAQKNYDINVWAENGLVYAMVN
jgi:anti-sigma factor RsiW